MSGMNSKYWYSLFKLSNFLFLIMLEPYSEISLVHLPQYLPIFPFVEFCWMSWPIV